MKNRWSLPAALADVMRRLVNQDRAHAADPQTGPAVFATAGPFSPPSFLVRRPHAWKRRLGWSRQHFAFWREAGSVARTIPGLLRRVPPDDARHVRADG